MIAVIDYGAGNLPNAVRALQRVGGELTVTRDPALLAAADGVVLPGVGATADTMATLQQLGLDSAIRASIAAGTPFLGICVGMQVLCSQSEEFYHHDCLGVVSGTVRRLPAGQKVPQIGWNQIALRPEQAEHPVLRDLADDSAVYFVHSFYCDLDDASLVAAETTYGLRFPSILVRDNLVATQFHPEKSGRAGLHVLANFVSWVERARSPQVSVTWN
jgi:imidazole glycerol-phosphate synthase subunit HisH